MARTLFKRLAGKLNSTRPGVPKDYEILIDDGGASVFTFLVYDETNTTWKGIVLTTSTSTSTTTTSTSSSTSTS